MAFLSCTSDFSPLFRLLDDYETHRSEPAPTRSSTCKSTSGYPSTTPARRTFFTPAFDVRELKDAYYLDGELPGVDQSAIDIEFTDPQTLVVKGRTERNYASTSPIPSSSPVEPRGQDTPTSSASRTSSPSWRQPTVEDGDEEDENLSDARSTASVRSASSSRSASAVVVEKPSTTAQTTKSSDSSPKEHYWIAERSVGDFQRTFSFPVRVDQDGVRAALKNGILSVVVPKEAAPTTKKIRIY